MAGVYIHIPFCRTRCHYCDFYKTLDAGQSDNFIESLISEIEIRTDYLGDEKVDSIYLGGGTPSLLDESAIGSIMEKLKSSFDISETAEITAEVNPDDTGPQFYDYLLRAGFNRLSIGVQSWDDEILAFLNRRHNALQARKSVTDATDAGFKNISVDLIYGIPGLSSETWKKSLAETFRYQITHLSAYHLTIEKNTVFGKMMSSGKIREIEEQDSEAQFNLLISMSRKEGFEHYEISNLCQPGHYSRHNTNYWKQVPYLGLGPSAHSYNGFSRQWNVSDINRYIKSIEKGKVPYEIEMLDTRMKYNEYIMTSLRTMWGADLDYVESDFNKETHDYLLNMASRFIKYGMLSTTGKNRLVLTDQGKMISDNIISELMMA